jgi:hypothetical protein
MFTDPLPRRLKNQHVKAISGSEEGHISMNHIGKLDKVAAGRHTKVTDRYMISCSDTATFRLASYPPKSADVTLPKSADVTSGGTHQKPMRPRHHGSGG